MFTSFGALFATGLFTIPLNLLTTKWLGNWIAFHFQYFNYMTYSNFHANHAPHLLMIYTIHACNLILWVQSVAQTLAHKIKPNKLSGPSKMIDLVDRGSEYSSCTVVWYLWGYPLYVCDLSNIREIWLVLCYFHCC